jgi:hypothetical protein
MGAILRDNAASSMHTRNAGLRPESVSFLGSLRHPDDDRATLPAEDFASGGPAGYSGYADRTSPIRTITVGPGIAPVSCLAARGLTQVSHCLLCITAGQDFHPAPKFLYYTLQYRE